MGLARMNVAIALELTREHSQADQVDEAGAPRSTLSLLSNVFLARTMLRMGAEDLRRHDRSETASILEHVDQQTSSTTTAFSWRGPDGSPMST